MPTKCASLSQPEAHFVIQPIFNFYVAAAAVLSNLKRIEVTYQPTTVTSQGDYIMEITCANRHQIGPQTKFCSNHCRVIGQSSKGPQSKGKT